MHCALPYATLRVSMPKAHTGLRTFLRIFRGVHKAYLACYLAVYEAMRNAKRITPAIVQRFCFGTRSHTSYT